MTTFAGSPRSLSAASIRARHGSYRAYFKHVQTKFAAKFGRYSRETNVDWRQVNRFLFVCKGNVCRSPYAEARARQLGLTAVSFGLETTGDVPANSAALRVARARGVDLTAHRSSPFSVEYVQASDLVVAFEPDHSKRIRKLFDPAEPRLTLLGLWSSPESRAYVADPYGKQDAYFEFCFDLIDSALCRISQLQDSAMLKPISDIRMTNP